MIEWIKRYRWPVIGVALIAAVAGLAYSARGAQAADPVKGSPVPMGFIETGRPWTGFYMSGGVGWSTLTNDLLVFSLEGKEIVYTIGGGYDYQFPGTKIVAGVFADYSFTGGNGTVFGFDKSWFVGARLGALLSDQLLAYGSLGYTSVDGAAPILGDGNPEGFTVGGGAELLLTKHMSLKFDYRHIDLGSTGGLFQTSQDEFRGFLNYRF